MKVEPERRDPLGTHWEVPSESRRDERALWELRAARWKALELARHVFGQGAGARSWRAPGRGSFRGLLHLEVPFRSLEDHRLREVRFLSLAAREELLSRVPVVYVFDPIRIAEAGTPPSGHDRGGATPASC